MANYDIDWSKMHTGKEINGTVLFMCDYNLRGRHLKPFYSCGNLKYDWKK